MQQGLFGDQPSAPEPARDPVQEVFDYLAERVYVTRIDMGLPAIGMSVIPKEGRSLIRARIDEHGYKRDRKGKPTGEFDVELGIATCRQVIDVDEADARRTKTFDYWNAITPFRPANFVGRLARWRPDGQHAAFGIVKRRGGSNDVGFNAHMPDAEREELLRKVSRGGSYGEDGHGGDTPTPRPAAPVDDGDPWDPRKLGFAE